jgi:SAM-dependent methyltransferase
MLAKLLSTMRRLIERRNLSPVGWLEYKNVVRSSRAIIAIPVIEEELAAVSGIGVDIGCGDGEIAAKICSKSNISIIGIDIDKGLIGHARRLELGNGRFLVADLASRPIRKIGVLFDFAYSNCCLNHLADHEVAQTLDDLRASLRINSRVVLLVPHWKRAVSCYQKIRELPNGVSALPEYGDRQIFRYGEWYLRALEDAGFEIDLHRDILIPDDQRLCERYQKSIGEPIFSLFVVHASDGQDACAPRAKAFDIAHDNRKFEIEMLWKRSVFYWGFIAASFVGFVATEKAIGSASIIFAAFGFLCSLAWSAGNRGSKYWQEYWENKVVHLQNLVTGDLFIDHYPQRHDWRRQFAPRRLSVSKLTIGISDYTVIVWLGILLFRLASILLQISPIIKSLLLQLFIIGTVIYGISLLLRCQSTD